jgi:hypothetical protein
MGKLTDEQSSGMACLPLRIALGDANSPKPSCSNNRANRQGPAKVALFQ